MVLSVAARWARINSGVISVIAPAGGGSIPGDEKPEGETAFAASLLEERNPGANGAQPCTNNPTAIKQAACSEKRFKTDLMVTQE